MPLKTDGAKIRELRERQALTLTEFAELLGYAVNSVHLIEVGKSNGGPKFIRAAAHILGCQITDITHNIPGQRHASTARQSRPAAGNHSASPTGLGHDQGVDTADEATRSDCPCVTDPPG